ncbi:urease subunit beta [Anaerovorax odorimutans]|uniref:urease subunit beta n=1 Tax=Anaerovorax odorimutans TaxID=109327 RepID=UPI002ED47DEE
MKYQVGQIIFRSEPVTINEHKPAIRLAVNNTGDRCIQVCSHYHFFEANPALKFPREKALGMRLDIPAGTAVRFEPGEDKKVSLVPYTGSRTVIGFRGMTMGQADDPGVRAAALKAAEQLERGGEK